MYVNKEVVSREDRSYLEGLVAYAILLGPKWLNTIDTAGLTFTTPIYAAIYQAYLQVIRDKEEVSMITIGKAMKIEAFSKLAILVTEMSDKYCPDLLPLRPHDVVTVIEILHDKTSEDATAKEILEAVHKIQMGVPATELAPALASSLLASLPKGIDLDADKEMPECLKTINENREKLKENPDGIIGIPTGYGDLDIATQGLRPGQVWVLGGITSAGKTTLGLNIMNSVLNTGTRTVMYSMEMTKYKVYLRLGSLRNNVSTNHLEKGGLSQEDTSKIMDDVGNLPLRIVNTDVYNIDAIITDIIQENDTNKTEIFVVDYIQHIETEFEDNEYRSMSHSIREFQKLATKLNVAILVLSQMANSYLRDEKAGGVPLYKGSGNIFFVSNVALEIQYELKPEALEMIRYNGGEIPKKITCHKNRDGAIRSSYILDNGATGKMREIRKGEYDRIIKEANEQIDMDAIEFFESWESETKKIS